jgi:hypothetical protein
MPRRLHPVWHHRDAAAVEVHGPAVMALRAVRQDRPQAEAAQWFLGPCPEGGEFHGEAQS